ncbi:MAG: aminoglycoside phosphotransferase family protein [Acidobacteriota bacterium]
MPPSEATPLPGAVSRFVAARFPGAGVTPLPGDASTRRYFRVSLPAHAPDRPGPGVTAEIASPGSVILSLQAGFDAESLPFIETTRLFDALGLPVPAILDMEPASGIIAQEDAGHRLLQDLVQGQPAPATPGRPLRAVPDETEIDRAYDSAIGFIVTLQHDGTPRVTRAMHAGRTALDADLFRRELAFFVEHLLVGLHQSAISVDGVRQVEAACEVLCAVLDREPRVLCHRDLHSRNLMVDEAGQLTILDHQDARLGPDTYDLVSLLADPYVRIARHRMSRGLARYLALTGSIESLDSLQARCDRMAVQRLLKAAGTFAAQKTIHGRDTYLKYLPPALTRARESLQRCPELAPLLAALAPIFARLAPPPRRTDR